MCFRTIFRIAFSNSLPIVYKRLIGRKLWGYEYYQVTSKLRYDRRSVGQSVLVSTPTWVSWPYINYCLTFTVLSMSGAPSDERLGPSFVLIRSADWLLNCCWHSPAQ
jgi:hypothetical protein